MSTGAGGRDGGHGAGQLLRWARQVLPALPRRAPRRLLPPGAAARRFPLSSRVWLFASLLGSSPAPDGQWPCEDVPVPGEAPLRFAFPPLPAHPSMSLPPTVIQHLMSGVFTPDVLRNAREVLVSSPQPLSLARS